MLQKTENLFCSWVFQLQQQRSAFFRLLFYLWLCLIKFFFKFSLFSKMSCLVLSVQDKSCPGYVLSRIGLSMFRPSTELFFIQGKKTPPVECWVSKRCQLRVYKSQFVEIFVRVIRNKRLTFSA